jgi:hypothetical protein
MQYPSAYKSNSTKIIKFDRDYKRELEYNFIGLFPINMSSVPISYDASDILKVSVAFNYERYISGKITSKSKSGGTSNNTGSTLTPKPTSQRSLTPTEIRQGIDRRGTDIRGGNFRTS